MLLKPGVLHKLLDAFNGIPSPELYSFSHWDFCAIGGLLHDVANNFELLANPSPTHSRQGVNFL